jgi:hypothetical protein
MSGRVSKGGATWETDTLDSSTVLVGREPLQTDIDRGAALVLRQAQDESYFKSGAVEFLILSLSKDEEFGPRLSTVHRP